MTSFVIVDVAELAFEFEPIAVEWVKFELVAAETCMWYFAFGVFDEAQLVVAAVAVAAAVAI